MLLGGRRRRRVEADEPDLELNWGRIGHATRKRMKHPCNLLANIIRTLANTLARKSGSGQLLPDRTPSKGLLRSRECSGQAVRILASLLAALSADSRVEAAPSKHESLSLIHI